MTTGSKAVFLDRDGVLNRALVRDRRPFPPPSLEAVEVLPGVVASCAALREAGALLFCVTNQPDVARGTARREDVEAINRYLQQECRLTDVVTCCHDDSDGCDCRKPKPGMLIDLAARYRVNLGQSVMVGDRRRDVEAGTRAGCRTVFIDYDYAEARPSEASFTTRSLAEAVPWILGFLNTGTS